MKKTIDATLVTEEKRMAFLPKFFGMDLMMRGENFVYNEMGRLCSSYNGGYWNMYELSNGGFYMAPDAKEQLHLVAENGFSGDMSADAAGIVASMYAINHLCHATQRENLIDAYHALREFAAEHEEAALIGGATD